MGFFDKYKADNAGRKAYGLHVVGNRLYDQDKTAEARAKHAQALKLYEEAIRGGCTKPSYVMAYGVLLMRFARFAVNVFGCEMDFERPEITALNGIERYESFLRSIGMPITFAELGAKAEDIPFLAKNVRRNPDGTTGHFVKLDTKAIEELLRIAVR